METVTLSTTAKNKARLARKRAHKDAEDGKDASAMDIDTKDSVDIVEDATDKDPENSNGDVEMEDKEEVTSSDEIKKSTKKKKEPEPVSFRVSNPSRVTKYQTNYCEFDLNQRYRPVRPDGKTSGVIILTDSTPDEEEDVSAVKTPSLDAEDEAELPEPFEWAPPGHAEYVAPVFPTEVKLDDSDKSN